MPVAVKKKPAPARPARPARAKRNNNVPEFVTAKELATIIGLSTKRVQILTNEGVLPREGKGQYRFADAVQAYIKFKAEHGARLAQTSAADQLRTRRDQEIAMRIDREARRLIPIDEAMAGLEDITGIYLESIGGMPARLTRNPRERQRFEAIFDEERLRISDKFSDKLRSVQTGNAADEADPEDDA